MFKINDVNFELSQIGAITCGYSDEYIEKTMLSGEIKRIYYGKRFLLTVTFAFLTNTQISDLKTIFDSQKNIGYVNLEFDNQYGKYEGEAFLDISNKQTRFKINEDGTSTWIDWQFSLKGKKLYE